MPSVALIAGEASGDASAAALALELRRACPDISIWGAGGMRMREAGIELVSDFSSCGAIGVMQSLKQVPSLLLELKKLKKEFLRRRPDVFVPVDFGAFNVTLGKFVREIGIPTVYYFPPGSWRRRPRDHSRLLAASDKIITPFPWSAEILTDAGGDAVFFGHPMLDRVAPSMTRNEFLGLFKCNPDCRIIGLLPGSRDHEISSILPVFLQAAAAISESTEFVIAAASERAEANINRILRRGSFGKSQDLRYHVVRDLTCDVMAHSDLLLTCSGTATLEAMILGTPMIIVYRGTGIMKLEYLFRKSILEEFIGMPNICANKMICPELIGDKASPQAIAELAADLLDNPEKLDKIRQDLRDTRQILGEPGAVVKSSNLILEYINH